MTKFDLSKQQNTDSLVLWKKLVNLIRTYEDVDSCEFFTDGDKRGVKVKFKNNIKVYPYVEKEAVIRLLKPEHKFYWKNLPF